MITHHWPKGLITNGYHGGTKARGASKWPEHHDVNIQCTPRKSGTPTVTLEFETRNCAAPDSITVELADDLGLRVVDCGGRRPDSTLAERIVDLLKEQRELGQSDLAGWLSASPSQISKAVAALNSEHRVRVRRGNRQRGEKTSSKYVALNDSGDGRGPHK
ncbi:MAG: hypothetical protein E4H03_05690 [Myxococcales bacterium]|nr:MAG: hypothetical protein E4H03_05690 [Myxococcales bacterium]